MGQMAVARRRHRPSEPVLRPHIEGASGELRRNSLSNIVVSADQRPRTASQIATCWKSVDDIAVSVGQQQSRRADSTEQDAGCRGVIELNCCDLPGRPSALDAQRPRTAEMKRPRHCIPGAAAVCCRRVGIVCKSSQSEHCKRRPASRCWIIDMLVQ